MATEVTIGDYLKDVFARFGVHLTDNEFAVLMLQRNVQPDENVTADFSADIILYYVIPDLLLLPDRTQGDSSIKWDRSAIKSYYAIIANRLGLPNELNGAGPSITDKSYIW
jgi:hypothetical protein